MNKISYEYREDKNWVKPNKYFITFNDGLDECDWWLTVMDKANEDEWRNFFDLSIGMDIDRSSVYTKHKVQYTGLSHKKIIKLITKGLTREMAYTNRSINYRIFNLDILATNALYNYLKDVKKMSNSEIIMTGDLIHTEFLIPGIIDKLELTDEQLLTIGKNNLWRLKQSLGREQFDRVFSNQFILENYDFHTYNVNEFEGRGLEKRVIKELISKSDDVKKTIQIIKELNKDNAHVLEAIKNAELDALMRQ